MGKFVCLFEIVVKKILMIVRDFKKNFVYFRIDCLIIKKRNWFENLVNLNIQLYYLFLFDIIEVLVENSYNGWVYNFRDYIERYM